MGKAGRVACIITPYALTIASIICIIMVGLGCTQANSKTLDNLYFIRVSFGQFSQPAEHATNHTSLLQADLQHVSSTGTKTTQQIESILADHGITNIGASQVSNVISQLEGDSSLKDFYDVGLWGYCDGDVTNNNYDTTWCSKPKSMFYFDPLRVWGLNNKLLKQELPSDYGKMMKIYKAVSKWMFIAYVLAFVTTAVEILVGFFAICSRWGSCVTTLFALVAFLFTTAASVTSTVLFSIMKSSAGSALAPYGIELSMGTNMYAATWLAVVFSLGALLFWTFSICCCSGRSPYNHSARERRAGSGLVPEKAPYTYEPLGAGASHHTAYGHQYNTSYPGAGPNEYPMTTTNYGRQNAYEPFRHV